MKPLLYIVAVLVAALPAFSAFAPDSLSGKVYRDSFAHVGTRSSGEKTILFTSSTRFVYLKASSGSALNLAYPYQVRPELKSDGSYTYIRSGENTAAVTLNFDGGGTETIALEFTKAEGGGSEANPSASTSFSLYPLPSPEIVPMTNVSMRGRVEPGRPLITGFVIPGAAIAAPSNSFSPAAGAKQREVLIRAVGPTLSKFGVSGAWANPDFQLVPQEGIVSGNNNVHFDDWAGLPTLPTQSARMVDAAAEAGLKKIFDRVGAFELPSGSKDAVQVARLNPGAYTIVASALTGDVGGEVIIEVYFLP